MHGAYICGMSKLQKWMDKNEVRDATVAASLKISRVQVNRIRRGNKTSVRTARKLERLTGIKWYHFIADDQPRRTKKVPA